MIDNKIYLKVDDSYLDCISRFRTSIDQMNTSFMDLIYFHRDAFLNKCKNIVAINHEFIRQLITIDSLTHDQQFQKIDDYYKFTDNQNKEIRSLLEDIKKDIEENFNNFYESDRSPISEKMKSKYSTLKKFNLLKKYLEESRESIKPDDDTMIYDMMIYDDFMESKIIPLFKEDNYDPYGENFDDDDDDDDNNNKRYFGNPYIHVPEEVQKSINEYLAFANSIISINTILYFDKVKEKYHKKAEDQMDKIKKEIDEDQKRKIIDMENQKIKELERLREQEKQQLIELDIPELKEMADKLKKEVSELESKKKDLEDKKEALEDEIPDLEIRKEKLEKEVHSLEFRKEKLEKEVQDLETQKEQIPEAAREEEKNKEPKENYEKMKEMLTEINKIKNELAMEKEKRTKSETEVEKLLKILSELKTNFDVLKLMK